MNEKLISIYLQNGEITISDLYQFSKISLKKKRFKKKFNKHYYKYVSDDIYNNYIGFLITKSLTKTVSKMCDFDLDVISMDDPKPKIDLVYIDYQYKNE
jgi:hypothetical protein